MNILGIMVILGVAWSFSKKRSAVNFKLVVQGLLLQFVLAFVALKTSVGKSVIGVIADGVSSLYGFAQAGVSFVFGGVGDGSLGVIFAFQVLPIIVFFGAFMALLFHIGIVQWVVKGISAVVRPLLGTSGSETLCAISNSFLGQTEAPLLVKNYLASMTKSEMLVVMVSGMATISGSILVVFASMGVPTEHLLSASVMAIPGSLIIAKMLYPETERSKTAKDADVTFESSAGNVLEAISQGTTDGMYLALNVGAMLISFIALIALINSLLALCSDGIGMAYNILGITAAVPTLSLNAIFSYVFAPFSYLLGFTGDEALQVGALLGTKLTVNEFVAYGEMLKTTLSARTISIVTYALCGFSNFSCIGIQIGGIGVLVPSKRSWLSELGLRALLGGSLSNLLSAMIASLFI
ncbi:hypothetical protein JW872_03980 [Candidatus Babeliales bacterium]|nr:hypothetical protein [Candidatus Babeliales bacterium]